MFQRRSILMFTLLTLGACKAQGSFPAEVSEPEGEAKGETTGEAAGTTATAPTVKHEKVEFAWQSDNAGQSGTIQTNLPDGEQFSGAFHQIRSSTTVDTLDGFYSGWYGDPWIGSGWDWDGGWPYYDDPYEYINFYSGQVVAQLSGDKGTSMRCHFRLDDPESGMKGGGGGECQLSNGDRITAVFPGQKEE